MRGRGFSSCLICEDYSGLVFGSKILHQILKDLYKDQDHDVMLSSTKICFGCVGRFQQLHQFWARMNSKKGAIIENAEATCRFCYNIYEKNELLPDEVQSDIRILVMKTEFREEFALEKHIICCFACSNFLTLYDDFKSLLMERSEYYFLALTRCSVNLNKNPQVKQEKPDVEAVQSIPMTEENSPSTSPIDEGYQEQSMSPATYQEHETGATTEESCHVEETGATNEENYKEQDTDATTEETNQGTTEQNTEKQASSPIIEESLQELSSTPVIEQPHEAPQVQYEIEIPHSQNPLPDIESFVADFTPRIIRELRSRSNSNGLEVGNIINTPRIIRKLRSRSNSNGLEIGNIINTPKSSVRSRSAPRAHLQDINENVVKRPRRQTLVPARHQESIDERKKVESPGTPKSSASSSKSSVSSSKKGRANSVPRSRKKVKYDQPELSAKDQELLAVFNVAPCTVNIERLAIESPAKQKAQRVRKSAPKGLKIRLTPPSKRKKQTKEPQPAAKKMKLETMPSSAQKSPNTINEEFKNFLRANSLMSPNLIITEDLPATLEISEGFSQEYENFQENVAKEEEQFNGFTPEEITPPIMQEFTEIEFIGAHRGKDLAETPQLEVEPVEGSQIVDVKVEPANPLPVIIEVPPMTNIP